MGVEKSTSRGVENKGGDEPRSTQQREILRLYTEEFLTARQIAIRRNCHVSAVYKILGKLRKRGLLSRVPKGGRMGVEKSGTTFRPRQRLIRLHGQQFHIKILHSDKRYLKVLNSCNRLDVDGNTVMLYPDSVEVYGKNDFYSEDVDKATAKSMDYWTRFFYRLENDLKILIVKSRSQNIKVVSSHYAEVENELARDCNIKAERIKVFARDDGKLWFLIDNSLNLNEAETVHPGTAKSDMGEVIKPFFNDLREFGLRGGVPPTLSQLMSLVAEVVAVNKETASGLNALVNLQSPQEDKIFDVNNLGGKPDYLG